MSEFSDIHRNHNDKRSTGDLNAEEFANLLGIQSSEFLVVCGPLIDQYDFRYDAVEGEELETTILKVIKEIDNGLHKPSGKDRKGDWEKGWQENWDAFVSGGYDVDALIPKYISKYGISRLLFRYVKPHDKMFELNFYTVYRHYLFKRFLGPFQNIFEFGCGTGYNLVIMNQLFPDKSIVGLDWTENSVKIADELGRRLKAQIKGKEFDFFRPDYGVEIPENSVVITLNSLEQLGDNYSAFLEYLLNKKPALCINSEPFLEFYYENNLLDYLAIRYHKSRNYLAGYYDALKQLEIEGRIRISRLQRVPVGNLFHEGFSFIVWNVVQ
ncbi:MAG: class I SAM-dependent methyltransferase [Deltaproteobacteria bacterium]|nr:class I SAM-dependent methyltransferase [Deltaproteobacteria bacterium]